MALTAEHVDAFLAAKDVLKMEVDGHRLATDVDQEQVADVKMMLKSLSEAGGVVVTPTPVAHEPETVKASVEVSSKKDVLPEMAAPAAPQGRADGLTQFHVFLPEISEKDVNNLKEELELLGSVDSTKNEHGRTVFVITTDSSQDDIVSICSFVLDPNDLMISLAPHAPTQVSPAPTVAPVAAVKKDEGFGLFEDDVVAKKPAASATSESASNDGKVKIHEEVGYGLFAEDGKESVEEGYGFFAPFKPHPDAVVATLIGDDTVATEANSGKAEVAKTDASNVEAKPTTAPPDGVER
jgi:two-component system chemotaxis sensor kinase CheA